MGIFGDAVSALNAGDGQFSIAPFPFHTWTRKAVAKVVQDGANEVSLPSQMVPDFMRFDSCSALKVSCVSGNGGGRAR